MSAHIPLRVERETRLIVTDDANDTYVLCIASKQPLAIGYEIVRAYNTHPALVSALEKYGDHMPECAVIQECGRAVKPACNCGYDHALRLARGEATNNEVKL